MNENYKESFYEDDFDDGFNNGSSDAQVGESGSEADTQALLDLGYEQLDGYMQWAEDSLGLPTRTVQQDCFNAEMLIDYLANSQHKAVAQINEFELRWFVYSHYIRKAQADEEIELRLPSSLQRFFGYLEKANHELIADWLPAILADEGRFTKRRNDYQKLSSEDEAAWKIGFQEWCDELEEDLDVRCLWLPREMGEGLTWNLVMGWREATLQEEANRLWQRSREELLLQGLDFETIRAELMAEYLEWLDSPQAKLDDGTPRDVVLIERMDAEETQAVDDQPAAEDDNDGDSSRY